MRSFSSIHSSHNPLRQEPTLPSRGLNPLRRRPGGAQGLPATQLGQRGEARREGSGAMAVSREGRSSWRRGRMAGI